MLENLKQEIIDISLEAQNLGLCKHKSGNFSIKDKETGYIVITPSGVDRKELTVDKISVLDQEFNLIEGMKPSSEVLMHAKVYEANPETFGIAHTHSKVATAFAVLNKHIPAVIFELFAFRLDEGKIPVSPYFLPGTMELADSVAATSQKSDLLLMEKHGVLAHGKNLSEAFLSAQYVEEIADIYYHTLTINQGKEPETIDFRDFAKWKYPEDVNQ
ncbi:MAG: class II aldolase/adducin family protein [Erysipelotrichaceae bacterium]